MKSKSGRKINDQLPETPALKSARKFRAKCAARLEEFEVLKKETLPKLYTAILELEAGGNASQTVSQIKSLLIPHLDDDLVCHGEFAQTQKLHQHPGPASHPIDLSGVDQFHSSEEAESSSSSPSMPYSPSSTNCPNGGTLDEWMILDNPSQKLWCEFVQQFTTEPTSITSQQVAVLTVF